MNIKVKDLIAPDGVVPVLELVTDGFYKSAINSIEGDTEAEKLEIVNKSLFEEAEILKDPNITKSEIKAKINSATQEDIEKNVKLALQSKFNYLQILSAPDKDNNQVFFVALAGIGGDGDAVELLSKQAQLISKNKIEGRDDVIGDFDVVVLDFKEDGTFIPRPIKIKD